MKKQLFFGLLYLSILACTPGKSQDISTSIPLDPKVRHGRLENGFTYYIRNYQDSVSDKDQRIFFQLIGPGGRFEDDDQQGLAHLIEHMVIETKSSHFDDIFYDYYIKNLSDRGHWLMQTGPYKVYYQWAIPDTDPELFSQSLQRLRDFAQDKQILKNLQNDELVDKHGRGTVLQEFNNHDRKRSEKRYKLLNEPKGHSKADPNIYVDRHNQNIKTFELESLVRFYKDWYRPDKQALIIVGNVDVDEVEKQIKGLFSDLKMPDAPRDKSLQEFQQKMRIALPGKGKVVTLTDSTSNKTQIEIYYHHSTDKINGTPTTKEEYRAKLIERLYNDMMSQRMNSVTQQYNVTIQSPLLHYIHAFPGAYQVESALTRFNVSSVASIPEAFGLVMKSLEQIRRYGFTRVELQRAKDSILEEINKNMGPLPLVYQYQSHYLFDALAPGPEYEREMATRMIEEITLEEVHHFAHKLLDSPDRDVVFTVPEDIPHDSLPDDETISGWIREIKKTDIAPFQDRDIEGPKQLISDAELSKLSEDINYTQKEIKELGVTQLLLDNGLQIFLKPLSSKKNKEIQITGLSQQGASVFDGRDSLVANKAADIVMNSGAGSWNKFELARLNREKKIELKIKVNENTTSIRGSVASGDIEGILQQIYLYVTEPNKNELAFKDWFQKEQETLRQRKNFGNSFYDLVKSEIYGIKLDEPKSQVNLADIQLDRSLELYRKLFSDASNFTYVIAGDFEVEAIKPYLLRYLGHFPTKSNNISLKNIEKDINIEQPVRGVNKTFYSDEYKNNYAVSINYMGTYPPTEEAIFKLEILREILSANISARGKMEGLYWPLDVAARFNNNFFHFSVIEESKEHVVIEKTKSIVANELYELKEKGPDITVFRNVISKLKSKRENLFRNSNPSWWCDYIMEQNMNGWDLKANERELSILKSLTPEEIRDIARKCFTRDNLSIIELLPESEKIQ
ncbi:insulinase family protein [Sinomicrobium pectinilyticum]|uniref:Insulinase family protein n=1 Tax=Sinomicrobium pectinilyticum TaxID=1084421 RepID=A0A3N0EIN4_SINP1|nr:insulinase family protein [Sinomicrobium pectinilyticum]RNL87748.1 insulinase family protein [Sinomicrobium pectinilyticum]